MKPACRLKEKRSLTHRTLTLITFLLTTNFLIVACGGGNPNNQNDDQRNIIGGLSDTRPQVASDGNGNFMAVWKSANAVVSRYYNQSSGQRVRIIGHGERPRLAMGENGDAYVTWYTQVPYGPFGHITGLGLSNRQFNFSAQEWSVIDDSNARIDLIFTDRIWDPEIVAKDDHALVLFANNSIVGDPRARRARYLSSIEFREERLTGQRYWFDSEVSGVTIAQDDYPIYSVVSGSNSGPVTNISRGAAYISGPTIRVDRRCEYPAIDAGDNRSATILCLANRQNENDDGFNYPRNTSLYAIHYAPPDCYGSPCDLPGQWGPGIELTYNDSVYREDYDIVSFSGGRNLAIWAEAHPHQLTTAYDRDDNLFRLRWSSYDPQTGWQPSDNVNGNVFEKIGKPVLKKQRNNHEISYAYAIWTVENNGARNEVNVRPYSNFTHSWGETTQIDISRLDLASILSEPVNLDQSMGEVDISIAPDGSVIAVWEQGGEVWMNRLPATNIAQNFRGDTSNGHNWLGAVRLGDGELPSVAVEDNGLCVILWKDDIAIREYICGAPVAQFGWRSTSTAEVPNRYMFDGSYSRDDDGRIALYEWDWESDGTFDDTGIQAEHVFPNPGIYIITLRVTDDEGHTNSIDVLFEIASGIEQYNLVLTHGGDGSGRIISTGSNTIDCGTTCSALIDEGTEVTIEAIPDEGSVFSGWSPLGCFNTNPAIFVMERDRECQALFAPDLGGPVNPSPTPTVLTTPTPSPTPTPTPSPEPTPTPTPEPTPVPTATPLPGNPSLTVIIEGGPGAGEVDISQGPSPIPDHTCTNGNEATTRCTVQYPEDSIVILTANAFRAGDNFTWTGCDFVGAGSSDSESVCRVTIILSREVRVAIRP